MKCCSVCTAKTFLKNWILYLLIALAIAGVVLALVLFLGPCDEVFSMSDIDAIVVVDCSGSVQNPSWETQMRASGTFLAALVQTFTGENFRAGIVQYSATSTTITEGAVVSHSLGTYQAAELAPLMEGSTFNDPGWTGIAREIPNGLTSYVEGLTKAHEQFTTFSDPSRFRLLLHVSDGSPNNDIQAVNQASIIKQDGITISAIMVGTAINPLYSTSSCTAANNTATNVPRNNSCPLFADAASGDLAEKARSIAESIEIPVEAVCLAPEYLAFLALILPLIVYLLLAPLAYCLKKLITPPTPIPAMSTDDPQPAGAGGAAGSPGKTADGKWATVNAGGYLWAMGGKGTAMVNVNFGELGATASAPQAHRDMQAAEAAGVNHTVAETAAEVYGGGSITLWVSKYLCCCIWMSLTEEDRIELEASLNGGAPSASTGKDVQMTPV